MSSTTSSIPTNLNLMFSGGALTLTWPDDHLGWIAQSKAVPLGNSNCWFDILGSQSFTNLTMPVNRTTPQIYYRLRYPF